MSVQNVPTTQDQLAAANVEEARKDLAESEIGKAFAALDRALSEAHDPEILKQVYELAVQAYAKASFVQRHLAGGHAILREAEEKLKETHL